MFIIVYKDGHRDHTYDEADIALLNWDEILMVVNTDAMKDY